MFACAHATRRALVIGIGPYPAESGWAPINGDKDIPMVKQILTDNGFASKDIIVLQNAEATYAGITGAMEKLISLSGTGDHIYIHFSGHGQQVRDTNGDEDDGYDEAWVCYDAKFAYAKGSYEGEHHLLDDELNSYLHRMREKIGSTGKLVVVADACHSGGGSRDVDEDESVVIRGTDAIFDIPQGTRTPAVTTFPTQWTFISACKGYQCNYEYRGNGSLTYALWQLRERFGSLTCKQISVKVRSCISEIVAATQTPVMETPAGAETETFF